MAKTKTSLRHTVADALTAAGQSLAGIVDSIPEAYPSDGENARENAGRRAQRNVLLIVVSTLSALLTAAGQYAANGNPSLASSTAFGRIFMAHAASLRSAVPGLAAAGSRLLEGRTPLARADETMGAQFQMHQRTETERQEALAAYAAVAGEVHTPPTPTRQRRKGVSPDDARAAAAAMV